MTCKIPERTVCNSSKNTITFFRTTEAQSVGTLMKRNSSRVKLFACRAIIASFGHWQVSDERALKGKQPYSVGRYAAKLGWVMQWLRKIEAQLGIPALNCPLLAQTGMPL